MPSLRPVSGSAEEILNLLRTWDAAEDPGPLMIETSGSTGRPKRVVLSRDALRASALATQDRLGGPGRWVLNLPPTYVAGVQVLYRSVVAGTEPVVFGRSFTELCPRMSGPAYVSLVGTQLARLLKEKDEVEALRRFDAVLIGGGPLRRAVRAEAERAGLRIVQTYGMSETCGGCVYDGVPLEGVEVRIVHDEVLLRGTVLFDGYDGEPDRTEAAFRDGWLVTHDLGHWDPDGRLVIDGRADDVIITGGVKVPAQAVAAMIAGREHGSSVEVIGVPDPEWGERVVAIVAADDPIPLDRVRDHVRPRTWAPRQLVVVQEIPVLPNGKPDRVAMRDLAIREERHG